MSQPRPWNSLLLPIDDSSQVGAARRAVAGLARGLGMDEADSGRAEIVTTELATNLLRHARDGRLLVRGTQPDEGVPAVEIVAVDDGPGMDVDRCMRDGYSSGGTAGEGLGAVQRLANLFDIASQPEKGTVAVARVHAASNSPPALQVGVVCLPMRGETDCGDGWAWRMQGQVGTLLVFDGLGHGTLAAEAAAAACSAFATLPGGMMPAAALEVLHGRLGGTRGGAAAIARIDLAAGTLHYAGMGNIAGTLQGEARRRGLPSHNGIVGSVMGRVQGFEYGWSEGDVLLMHSDGIQSRWSLDHIAGATSHDPALLAGLLYRDYERGRDDLTVAVVAHGARR